jgi:Concanavalin A-like lectin/glucanases superfamily
MRARTRVVPIAVVLLAVVVVVGQAAADAGFGLRFRGNGVQDIDRVKIRIDDPSTSVGGPPVDVGTGDFTIELWLKGTSAENPAPAVSCGANNNWIFGNIVVDRDRYDQDRDFGVSIAGGRVTFGVGGAGTGERTICGTSNVLNGQWHHIAVQRRRADGWLWLYIDGVLQAQGDGPDGDVSYPDNGVPRSSCGGPCTNSDPFLVIGAEKHDAGPQYPSFAGWVDELRISTVLRYTAGFARPSAPFVADTATAALYHFDEGAGNVIGDSSAKSSLSPGVRRFGGNPAGPEWVVSDAPLTGDSGDTVPPSPPDGLQIKAAQ